MDLYIYCSMGGRTRVIGSSSSTRRLHIARSPKGHYLTKLNFKCSPLPISGALSWTVRLTVPRICTIYSYRTLASQEAASRPGRRAKLPHNIICSPNNESISFLSVCYMRWRSHGACIPSAIHVLYTYKFGAVLGLTVVEWRRRLLAV